MKGLKAQIAADKALPPQPLAPPAPLPVARTVRPAPRMVPQLPLVSTPPVAVVPDRPPSRGAGSRNTSREGKRAVVGHFSPEMARAIAVLARMQDKTVQHLMAEAFDDLMVKYGQQPFGER